MNDHVKVRYGLHVWLWWILLHNDLYLCNTIWMCDIMHVRSLLFKCLVCSSLLWCIVGVSYRVLNALFVSYLWLEGYCICVVVFEGWFPQTHVADIMSLWGYFVHTHISCITINVICSWCQLKGSFSYAPSYYCTCNGYD